MREPLCRVQAVEVVSVHTKPPGYTQGLAWLDASGNDLVESTGLYGESKLCHYTIDAFDVSTATWTPTSHLGLPPELKLRDDVFAEGVAKVNDSLFVLTWREQCVIEVSLLTGEVDYRPGYVGEGWGVAALPNGSLVTSDGSSALTVRDAASLDVKRVVKARVEGKPLAGLNAMTTCLTRPDHLWANIFGQDVLALINLATGNVSMILNCSTVRQYEARGVGEELNGVLEYYERRDTLLLTIKQCSLAFEVTPKRPMHGLARRNLIDQLPVTASDLQGIDW